MILLGCLKRKREEKFYCQSTIFISRSGINLKVWMERALVGYTKLGITLGPRFKTTVNGGTRWVTFADLDDPIHNILLKVQKLNPRLIPMAISVHDELV